MEEEVTKRYARPGMAPSPNQQIVLDVLKEYIRKFGVSAVTIKGLARYMEERKIPDFHMCKGEWIPWHPSTVRDHLNDLTGKEHVVKEIRPDRRAWYRPA